jgi:hypothetical protein
MKISRSSILTGLVVAVLLLALPSAIQRFLQTGDIYLFSRQFLEDLVARLSGPGRIRFVLQPLAAILLGIRSGVKDARVGLPPFVYGLAFHGTRRRELLRSAFESVRDLVAVAILLDVVSQILIFREVHPGAALIVGPVLITLPYSIVRAWTNRIACLQKPEA